MLAGVEQGPVPLTAGERTHSTLILANELSYRYRRDTVTIYGNVAKATHGETRKEVLGSGDAGQPMQVLPLRQSPLTYLPAATPAGAESTLEVRVDDVLWHESDSLVGLGPKDRRYVTSTDDDDKTSVIFGDGRTGARLSTGRENVKAVYRTGIGAPGNVGAGQISLLATRPLGVKSVVNPLPATGGANREDRDTARRNAPMAVMALDRLISAQDYEDFARTYAGIGKASAAQLSDGRRQVVHLTIAGSDDIPIGTTSDLFVNLGQALRKYGDPFPGLQVVLRKLELLVISAKVKLDPDYLWEAVEPKVRAALFDTFGFARRELGQDALASEAISAIQAQPGVAYVDLDVFDSVSEDATVAQIAGLGKRAALNRRIAASKARPAAGAARRLSRILPAELAYLSAKVPDMLILAELR
jgi:predicted phage baseplate assembly protein